MADRFPKPVEIEGRGPNQVSGVNVTSVMTISTG
jgi:hypothetical protein